MKLADSALGAIVTHATVCESGEFIIAAESGFVIYWNVQEKVVIFKEEQKDILQVELFDEERKSLVVSKAGNTQTIFFNQFS